MTKTDRAVPVFEVEGCSLRIGSTSLAPVLSEYLLRNREHFRHCMPLMPGSFFAVESCEKRLAAAIEEYQEGQSLKLLLLTEQGSQTRVIGDLSFTNITRGVFQACHLGYKIDRQFQGQNLMYEALRAALGHVFDEMGLHRVMANYPPTNERSGRLLRRLNFTVEGYARDYLLLDGQWQDHILTSLVNTQWTQ